MKIVHFIHSLNTGGAETLVKNYISNFDCKKNEHVLLCIEHCAESPYESQLSKLGIKMIFVEDNPLYKKSKNVFFRSTNSAVRYIAIRRIIRREKPNILHAHLFVSRFIKFAAPTKKTIIFYTVHSEPKKLWSIDNKKKRKEFNSLKWLVKNYNTKFLVLHEKMKDEINKLFDVDDSAVLNNGIEITGYRCEKNKNIIRDKLSIPRDAFVVGHVGRLSEVKNHSFLVDTFKEIKKTNKYLLLVGSGEKKEQIIRQIEEAKLGDKYKILSNRDDMPYIYSAMDVFLFPSKYEGIGIALIEAQESKLPCFVSDTIPKHAIISNLVTRLSLYDEPKKWACAIENNKNPDKIVVNDEDWDVKKITKQLEKLYENAYMELRNGKK